MPEPTYSNRDHRAASTRRHVAAPTSVRNSLRARAFARSESAAGSGGGWPRGFALPEAALATVVVVVLLAILVIMASDSRRLAGLGQDMANLRFYGQGTATYASDHEDLTWGFSWTLGSAPHADPDLAPVSTNQIDNAARQAIQIIRDRGNRPDIQLISPWAPHIQYSHLVLTDYLNESLPSQTAVSSGDTNRLLWSRDPAGFDAGLYTPSPLAAVSGATNNEKRWPYSSSWRLGVAFFDRAVNPQDRITWGGNQSTYQIPGGYTLGAPRIADVHYPSQKALMFDEFQRHHGTRQAFYGYVEARVPVLAVDGAVAVRTSGDANIGWDPRSPTISAEGIVYANFDWELRLRNRWYPGPLNGELTDFRVKGRYLWTRGGIEGRDFDGPEVNTGQR